MKLKKEIKISLIFFLLAIFLLIFIQILNNKNIINSLSEIKQEITFFDDSYVHRVDLYLDDSNWYETLYSNHQDEDDPYEPGILSHEGYTFYPVGIRFKGSSSFNYGSEKKSVKIDINEFFEDCSTYDRYPECEEFNFYGLEKINFNNAYKDPSFMREKVFFDIINKYLPTPETVFVDLYINDENMGLYIGVEQIDSNFIKSNYGTEQGNLFECERNISDGGGQDSFGSDLSYISDNKDDYYDYYELKMNEGEDDAWESFLHFINVLNNYSEEDFIEEFEKIADIDGFLYMLAFNNIFANYDSYYGSGHNYLLYEDSEGKFHPIFWDGNESFGLFSSQGPQDQLRADIFYGNGVLEKRFFNIDKYRGRYLEIVEDIITIDFNVENITKVVNNNADLIRDFVYNDTKKVYSNEEFESALFGSVDDEDIKVVETTNTKRRGMEQQGQSTGLIEFVRIRSESIQNYLDKYNNN